MAKKGYFHAVQAVSVLSVDAPDHLTDNKRALGFVHFVILLNARVCLNQDRHKLRGNIQAQLSRCKMP
jgi:hypothetical protein